MTVWRQQKIIHDRYGNYADAYRCATRHTQFEDVSGVVELLDGNEGHRIAREHASVGAIAVKQS